MLNLTGAPTLPLDDSCRMSGPLRVSVHFAADPSVGINAYGYSLEVPDFRCGYTPEEAVECHREREQLRTQINALYELMDGEFRAQVFFSDQQEDEPSWQAPIIYESETGLEIALE